jgi:prepilin peptidase CpaA
MIVSTGLVLAACIIAAYSDIRTRRISNWLTGCLAIAAIVVHAFYGLASVALTALIMVAALFLGVLVYSRGGLGGGDVKLAIAAAGMLGYPLCIAFLLYTAIGGGLLAIGLIVATTIAGAHRVAPASRESMPYAVAFAFGATTVFLSQTVAPFLRMPL